MFLRGDVLNQQLLNAVAEMRPLRRRAGETCVAFDIPKNRAKCNRDTVNCQCTFYGNYQNGRTGRKVAEKKFGPGQQAAERIVSNANSCLKCVQPL